MEREALYYDLAEYYDRIYASKDYEAEARRLTRLALRLCPGARTLLDVACGTGRHLASLRERFAVQGLDASAPMLRVARRRLGRSVLLRHDDMRTFDLPGRFDVIVCLFSAIGYLRTRADRQRAFRAFYRHLNPGGVAFVEGWLFPSEFRSGSAHLQTYEDPAVKIARVSVARRRGLRSTIEMDYLVGESGRGVRHWREVHRQALVEPSEMLATMRAAGFRAYLDRSGTYRSRGLYIGRRP